MAITRNGSQPAAADVTTTGTATFTNKSISLGSNTVTGTIAQFNTAVTDADLATLAGAETLTNKTLTSPVISSITNTGTLTLPTSTGTLALTTDIPAGVVTESASQTLTNKTLTSPTVSGLTLSDSSIVLEGTTANNFETTLTVTDPTADRTITFPDSTGTVALTSEVINNTLTSTTGDLIYASSANTPARLGIGSSGQILTVSGGIPSWGAAPESLSPFNHAFLTMGG